MCVFPAGTEAEDSPRVVTVILPENRGYFVQHLGYFLATFLLLAFIVLAVVVLTRRRKKRGTVPLTRPLSLHLKICCYYERKNTVEYILVFYCFLGTEYELRTYDR